LDAGTGSGALACFLARFVKKVTTYDIREDHQSVAKKNAEFLGLKNVTFKQADIFSPDKVKQEDIDLFTLDVTTPWDAIETAEKVLKRGGYLVSYSPNLTQIARMANALEDKEGFEIIKVEELIEREWDVKGDRILRPKMRDIAHSGFLIFAKKIL
jgi:tRNA (adenine57-N1/adenine58-N1)-methyltransferase